MVTAEEISQSREAFIQHMRSKRVADSSPRTPKFSRKDNTADVIQAQCQEDGHRIWGFVIYRSTYENDADWEEVMRRLRYWALESANDWNGLDVLDKMTWTVFNDRSSFDSVPTSTIRQHFKGWCQTAVIAEQGTANPVASARYQYCVQIDAESMASILQEPAPPATTTDTPGWVKLILEDWLPVRENQAYANTEIDSTIYPPIEGMTEQHVGFVRVPIHYVMFGHIYKEFREINYYFVAERRPPEITI